MTSKKLFLKNKFFKKNRKKSITYKLFGVTAVFFILFITTIMIVQSLFIGKFYLKKKVKNFQQDFISVKDKFDKNNFNNQNNSNMMVDFENKDNAVIALYDISLATLVTPGEKSSDNGMITMLPKGTMGILRSALVDWTSNPNYYIPVISKHKTIFYKDYNEENDIIVAVTPIVIDNKVPSVIIAASSLQPIGEASSAIREFFIYFYAIALVLILILSLVYSNMISKPLVRLNKVALKMANLDFSSKCAVKGNDEIGNLAGTLNFLSENLGHSLNELKTANEKLKKDIEKEKQLEKMRKEFIAGVSHELKTPISLISGYAEGLKDNIAEGEEKDYYIDVILDESQKMSLLISDMLDLSRLESGNYKLKCEDFSINNMIKSHMKKNNNLFSQKNIAASLKLPEKEIFVYADPLRIEQVITNLVGNAIKHTPEGGFINVTLKDNAERFLIEVENSGEHIPEEEFENIWQKFYKVEKSRNRNIGGTGIGLSIVKDIVLLHHGSYGVKNTENGVCFYFTLNQSKK